MIRTLSISMLLAAAAGAAETPLRVLVLSGANNHNWQKTTPEVVRLLTATGRFTVAVREDVTALTPADLDGVALVVGNYNQYGLKGPKPVVWDAAMRAAFMAHITAGMGFASFHAGSTLWYDWPEFFRVSGGRWGKGTNHGKAHRNTLQITAVDHPITRGLPAAIPHYDEFWQQTEMAPDAAIQILATVTPDPAMNGSGKAEPMAWATTVGRGRGFNLLLGHDEKTMAGPAFSVLFVRGCLWAATGTVPAEVPGTALPQP